MTPSATSFSALVIAGNASGGKTAAILTVSEIPIIGTDALATDTVAALKQCAAVAMGD